MLEQSEQLIARDLLASEWHARSPQTSAEIAEFYRTSSHLKDDLEAWHAGPERPTVTEMLVHVAKLANVQMAIDIGCGTGHDLRALRSAGVGELYGIEPNDHLRAEVHAHGFPVQPELIVDGRLRDADLIICVDVLEHVPQPEVLLEKIASNAKLGAYLFEATATHDKGTPLHLKENRAWHPGHCLEKYGWWLVDNADRVRVWQRKAEAGPQSASILACIYRSMSTVTHHAILDLLQSNGGWRERVKPGDALIARSRAIITTSWWAETNDDVFLMVDDDVAFTREDAEGLVDLVRQGHDIVCGAYPVHNGEHFAIKMLPGEERKPLLFGEGDPIEIRYAATGFMAVHRRVIDALVPTLPLCEPWSFYPFFQALVVEDEVTGDHTLLSEDWGFCEMARQLGFKVWLDPRPILGHESLIPVSVRNMHVVSEAVKRNQPGYAQQESTNGRA